MNILSNFPVVQYAERVGHILKLHDEGRIRYSVRLDILHVSAETGLLSDAVTVVRAFYPDVEILDDETEN